MSHAGLILGLPELEVERVDRNDAIAVYAKPKTRPNCIRCQYPRVRIKATYQRTLKHTRQGNQLITLHLRAPKYHSPRTLLIRPSATATRRGEIFCLPTVTSIPQR
jgi:transposase